MPSPGTAADEAARDLARPAEAVWTAALGDLVDCTDPAVGRIVLARSPGRRTAPGAGGADQDVSLTNVPVSSRSPGIAAWLKEM